MYAFECSEYFQCKQFFTACYVEAINIMLMYIFIWIHGFFFIKAFVYETSWHYDWEPSVYNAYRVGGSAVFLSGTTLASFFSDDRVMKEIPSIYH